MPLFNTISASTTNEVKTYNYISNSFPSGVPTGSLADANGTPGNFTGTGQTDWIPATLPNTAVTRVANTLYFYFPAVPETPTRNETLTVQPTSSLYRFSWAMARPIGIINNTSFTSYISTNTDGSTTNYTLYSIPAGSVAEDGFDKFNFFNFGAISSTTMALAGFYTPTAGGGDLLTTATASVLYITGWLHNHTEPMDMTIYPSLRFNPCYSISIRSVNPATALAFSSMAGGRVSTLNNSTVITCVHGYSDLACSAGNSTVPVLTDLPIFKLNGNFRVLLGTADNRVVCMGRGVFQAGRVYRISNCFGRSGSEDWLCIAPYTPTTYNVGAFTIGTDASYTKVWKINEEDYVFIRVFTEGS